jgi:hypothetical protein
MNLRIDPNEINRMVGLISYLRRHLAALQKLQGHVVEIEACRKKIQALTYNSPYLEAIKNVWLTLSLTRNLLARSKSPVCGTVETHVSVPSRSRWLSMASSAQDRLHQKSQRKPFCASGTGNPKRLPDNKHK